MFVIINLSLTEDRGEIRLKKACHDRLSEYVFKLIGGFLLVFSCSRIAIKEVLKRVTEGFTGLVHWLTKPNKKFAFRIIEKNPFQ